MAYKKTVTFTYFHPGVSVATCMAILHVGTTQQVRTGSTSSKEEDYENDAATIVQKCVSRWEGVQLLVFFFHSWRVKCIEFVFVWIAVDVYYF